MTPQTGLTGSEEMNVLKFQDTQQQTDHRSVTIKLFPAPCMSIRMTFSLIFFANPPSPLPSSGYLPEHTVGQLTGSSIC